MIASITSDIFSILDNEWKVRYEIQRDINEQLSKQIATLNAKIAEGRETLKARMLFLI